MNKSGAMQIFLSVEYRLSTRSYNKIYSEVQLIDLQKMPVLLSKCGAISYHRIDI